MLRIGLHHGHDAILLGAWGCGAFRNLPEHMAQLFHEVLNEEEFARKFRFSFSSPSPISPRSTVN